MKQSSKTIRGSTDEAQTTKSEYHCHFYCITFFGGGGKIGSNCFLIVARLCGNGILILLKALGS